MKDRKPKVIVKRQSETSSRFGCEPDRRSIEEHIDLGIVVVDKPKGPTSHQVSAYVQQILSIKKSGHSGTLDPKVTGVLPVALGRATRIVEVLLKSGKEYVGIMHLHKEVPEIEIFKTCEKFVGKISQLPPIKSAVKRQVRERRVYYLDVLEVSGQDVLFRTGTQAGTYIRKLCHDIGEALGVGAHMTELRRTKAGPFVESDLHTLQELRDAYYYYKEEGKEEYLRRVIRPVEDGVAALPKVWVLDTSVNSLCHGANLHSPGVARYEDDIEPDQAIALMTLKGELIALAKSRVNSKGMAAEKGLVAVTHKVFMQPGTYPRVEPNPQ